MFFILLIIFILVPVIELNILIKVGESLGIWVTASLVILTAVVGVSLVRSQGVSTLLQVQQKLAQGETPGQQIVEGMMLALAGFLLLMPGFITDFLGLLLLTPLTRIPIAKFLYLRLQLRASQQSSYQSGFNTKNDADNHSQEGRTFEGDFEHKNDDGIEDKNDNDRHDPKN